MGRLARIVGGVQWARLKSMKMPNRDGELLQIMDAELARAAEVAGEHLVCKKGCTACCHGAFRISQLDAARLRTAMAEMWEARPELASEIERRAKKWIAENGVEFPGSLTTGLLGESDDERARFEEYANDVACPALNLETGLCEVYEARPMTCRVFGPPVRMDSQDAGEAEALGHCELCFTEATEEEVRKCEMSVPHELEAGVMKELEGAESLGETLVVFALL